MTEPEAAVADVFGGAGTLAQHVTEYTPRAGQIQMAQAVARVMSTGGALVVEAGTGIGKTYAYLVPALQSGHKVLISTATKALQDQLFGRDIPELLSMLKSPARVALLKGRSSYLCLHRLASARHDGMLQTAAPLRLLAQVEQWAAATRQGDVAEVPALEESSQVLPLVTSTRESCTASKCPRYADCFLYKARRDAMNADMVVINHHLFFADSNVRESGVAELLPTVNTVVFDEAHQLNDIGVQFLGRQWSTGQILALGRDVVFVGAQSARGLADWPWLVEQIEMAVVALHAMFPEQKVAAQRAMWQSVAPDGLPPAVWASRITRLGEGLRALARALEGVRDAHPDLKVLWERTCVLLDSVESALLPAQEGLIRWVESGLRLRCVESPMDISEAMRAKVAVDTGQDSLRSWIFTSATLGVGQSLDWFLSSSGLQDAECLRIPSPFDYLKQAAVYVPKAFALPSSPQHSHAVAELASESVQILGGHTLVLTTTLRAMKQIGESIRQMLPGHIDIRVLVQGEASKRDLLAQFQAANGRGMILVGSATFWEGVDIPGRALQLLVIDKIPFAPPDDPLLQARCAQAEQEGRSPFNEIQLPMAGIALKQGVGRLIRRESDRGVLVVCDSRLRQMGYGKKLLTALPPMRPLSEAEQYYAALHALTRVSTTDPY
ncbi:ATP-dependent DNA helicase [Rhodoferax sp.]|uniref:ATP-dependent DNA helicase n=1 Tax=Rhodoferax sp. TaxID=50421 RepID=UPI0025E52D0E|nr:ATP-dependent DNA helicase [Rhodoferax sp.]